MSLQGRNEYNKHEEFLSDFCSNTTQSLKDLIEEKESMISRIQECKTAYVEVINSQKEIGRKDIYEKYKNKGGKQPSFTVDDLILKNVDFPSWAAKINSLISGSKAELASECTNFYLAYSRASQILAQEIKRQHDALGENLNSLHKIYDDASGKAKEQNLQQWDITSASLEKNMNDFISRGMSIEDTANQSLEELEKDNQEEFDDLTKAFLKKISPEDFLKTYLHICELEPNQNDYECCESIPNSVKISMLEYDLSEFQICEDAKNLIEKYYPFMYRNDLLQVPYCTSFGKGFNYNFRF